NPVFPNKSTLPRANKRGRLLSNGPPRAVCAARVPRRPTRACADRRARRGRGTQIIHSGADHVAGFRTRVAVMWALLSTLGGARLSARSAVQAGVVLWAGARGGGGPVPKAFARHQPRGEGEGERDLHVFPPPLRPGRR